MQASAIGNASKDIRHDWSAEEVQDILEAPLMDLLYRAQTVHRQYNEDNSVQLASLLNIKTGSCPEDCKYCSQSAHRSKKTKPEKEPLMTVESVLEKARIAKNAGATRFCMGAAWRQVRDDDQFEAVLSMIGGVHDLGMEACVTLGMLNQEQATRLAEAGLTTYNHNLDTSPEFYDQVITTRTFRDRLATLDCVRKAGLTICSGGIIGLGESNWDRARMLQVLANFDPHPENVPINALVPVEGTPLENAAPVEALEMVRMIATARIVMPKARVRLSAGRSNLAKEAQILCLMAGANSIFYGEKLLTTPNADTQEDLALIEAAGLKVAS
jgi:biotin synthase